MSKTEEEIEWEDPPTRTDRGYWARRLVAVKAANGKWAKFPGGVKAVGYYKGRHPEFEWVGRTVDGEGFTYVRYIGNGSEP